MSAGLILLLLNSAYLAAFATPSLFYFTNVVLHMVLGLVLGIVWARRVYVARTHGGNARPDSEGARPEGRAYAATGPYLLCALVLAAGGLCGVAIMVVGAAGRTRWLLPAHIALTIIGGLPLLARAAWLAGRQARSSQRLALGGAYAVVLVAFASALAMAMTHASRVNAQYRIENPTVVPASMQQEGRGPHSPFFPSSADTNVRGIIPANFFMTSESCGRCHTEIFNQWKSSTHHFSSFNNQWYRKSIEYMQDVVGTTPSKWCAGCHDHAVFFNGRFDRPIKEQIDTPEAQAGLGCTSCHAITRVGSTMGQGDFEVEYPPLHDLAASDNPLLRFVHDQLTYIDPAPHREIFLKPFHRDQTAEFCSSCHKVHLDVPVNSYRWFRGFNDYDNWQASGVSGQGARSFYYPPKSQKCADCHMPLVASSDPAAKNGKIKSHRFAAANTALPFVNHDPVQLKAVQDFLRDGQVSVDVFGLVRGQDDTPAPDSGRPSEAAKEPRLSSTFAAGEESLNFGAAQTFVAKEADVIAPLDKVEVSVRRGESVRVEVVVRTRKVGHFFPGGTVDAFDVWVELEAVDDKGRVLLHSGEAADGGKGPVESGAHFYRSLQLDEHGNPINKRNAWATRSVAYVRLIPPGAADTIHYRLQVPEDAGDHIYIKAKVNYRKFAWWNTQWAYSGVRDPAQKEFSLTASHDDGKWIFAGDTSKVSGQIKAIPDIPTTVMAESRASLRVLPRDAALPETAAVTNPAVRERWNDYGIGLLLQGDIRNAEATFLKVTRMDPRYADGWVNVARARIQEGNMSAARDILRKALEVDPVLAKTHFFLGLALKSLGEYDESLTHLRTAAALYPRDRVVVNQLGRVLFLKRDYPGAIQELTKVLAIDPEDLQAHYNLMLSYQGLGDAEKASREQTLYIRFKADESAQAITGPYRQLHPDDNNERQQIHEHKSPTESRPYPVKAASASRAGGGH
jgi:tetratricopeptide (TPR) repeat protein